MSIVDDEVIHLQIEEKAAKLQVLQCRPSLKCNKVNVATVESVLFVMSSRKATVVQPI
jgi:hypothetical protein